MDRRPTTRRRMRAQSTVFSCHGQGGAHSGGRRSVCRTTHKATHTHISARASPQRLANAPRGASRTPSNSPASCVVGAGHVVGANRRPRPGVRAERTAEGRHHSCASCALASAAPSSWQEPAGRRARARGRPTPRPERDSQAAVATQENPPYFAHAISMRWRLRRSSPADGQNTNNPSGLCGVFAPHLANPQISTHFQHIRPEHRLCMAPGSQE